MEAFENLSNEIDTCLPRLNKSHLISVLTQLGISTEGKPDVIFNKRKLMRGIQKGYKDIMGDEGRDLEGKVKHLQDLLTFAISITDSNGEHHKDVEYHDQGETLQQQRKTVTPPHAESTGTEQHQSTLDCKKTVEQVYAGPTGMYTMPYMRELGGYLGQTSLLRKDFKIRRIIGNSGQKVRISFVSLTHQINDGRTAGYSDNKIVGSVLKAMSPNLRLRNVSETMEGLTLETLLRFLQSHFGEGNTPDLCSQLTSMAQLSDEQHTILLFVVWKCVRR